MYHKNFEDWSKVKQRVNEADPKPYVRAGEVRWAAVGVNVGSEIDGKGAGRYTRPVLVLDTVGSHLALVIPLSTKKPDRPGYFPITVKDRDVSLCALHMKSISQQRLYDRVGKISRHKLQIAKEQAKTFWRLD
jgi:mRNA-degrading endonuclease toxin of MazEF toxin-antitoxin module